MNLTGTVGAVSPTPAPAPDLMRTGGRPKRLPVRTCVACRTSGGKRGLLRVVRTPGADAAGGAAELDLTGKKNGRGAYICPTPACVETALKRKALERSLKSTITAELVEALRGAAREMENAEGEIRPGT